MKTNLNSNRRKAIGRPSAFATKQMVQPSDAWPFEPEIPSGTNEQHVEAALAATAKGSRDPGAWCLLGTNLMAKGDIAANKRASGPCAIGAFRQALRLKPKDPMALTSLATCHYRVGRDADAVVVLRRMIRYGLDDWRIWILLGMAELNLGRIKAAVEAFRSAWVLNSERVEDMWLSMETLLDWCDDDTAALRQVVANPTNPRAWKTLGLALEGNGRIHKASISFRESLALNRGDHALRKRLRALDRRLADKRLIWK